MKLFKQAMILLPIISSSSLIFLLPVANNHSGVVSSTDQTSVVKRQTTNSITSTIKPHYKDSILSLDTFKLNDQIKLRSYNYNPTFQLNTNIEIVSMMNPELNRTWAASDIELVYEWHHINDQAIDKIIEGQTTNKLTIPATNDFNNSQIYLKLAINDATGANINNYTSNKMKVWISNEPQKPGEPVQYFQIDELKKKSAREITQSEIISIILTPENIMKLFDNLPNDYEQKACFYRPLLYGDNVVASNVNRKIKIIFQLGYGIVDGMNTIDPNTLINTRCEITISGFNAVQISYFSPVDKKRMETSLNATNIVEFFKNNDFKFNTTAASSFFTINGEPPRDAQVIKVTIIRNTYESTIIEFTVKNVYYEDKRLNDIILGQRKIQFNITGYKPGWNENTINTFIVVQGDKNFVDNQTIIDYSKQKEKLSTISILLISGTIAIFAIVLIVVLLLLINHKSKTLVSQLYV